MTRRTEQLGEFLRAEVTDIIRSELDDPRLGFWTITRVEVPPDLRSARVYVSVLGSDGERKETLMALRGAAGFIRGHLKPRMRTRTIPDLDFRDDRSMEHAEAIDRALRDLSREGEPTHGAPRSRGEAVLLDSSAHERSAGRPPSHDSSTPETMA
jgi:ribosome-binding factor A